MEEVAIREAGSENDKLAKLHELAKVGKREQRTRCNQNFLASGRAGHGQEPSACCERLNKRAMLFFGGSGRAAYAAAKGA